ncbi:hypothetical protein [Azospirillum argentinense]
MNGPPLNGPLTGPGPLDDANPSNGDFKDRGTFFRLRDIHG